MSSNDGVLTSSPPWMCFRVPDYRQAAILGPADLLQRLRVITDDSGKPASGRRLTFLAWSCCELRGTLAPR
jgi:hypothetical protein